MRKCLHNKSAGATGNFHVLKSLKEKEIQMKEEKKNYEIVEYTCSLPFRIHRIRKDQLTDKYGNVVNVLEHWHREIELVYTFAGHATHYIDGYPYTARPGSMFVTNSESIHKIMSDTEVDSDMERIVFGSALAAWLLAAAGYVGTEGAVQSDAVISAIRFDYGWLGAILSALLIVAVLFMDVEKYLPQIREEFGKKKQKEETDHEI